MRILSTPLLLLALALALQPIAAMAYIGPGVVGSAITTVIAVIGSIFLAIFAVIWYPIKRMIKGKKKPAQVTSKSQTK